MTSRGRTDGSVDINAWRYDIIARLLIDMENQGQGFSTRDLCMIYFGFADMEKLIWVGDQMQAARAMLQDRPTPLLLRSYRRSWRIVHPRDSAGARAFILDRAKRFIRAGRRVEQYSEIGQATYALPAGDPLLTAIEGAQNRVEEIAQIVLPQLPQPPQAP